MGIMGDPDAEEGPSWSSYLPTLSWPAFGGPNATSGGGAMSAVAAAGIGMVPMAVSSSLNLQRLTGNADEETNEDGGDDSVASINAPCSLCAGLSLTERIIGFALCFLGGSLLQVASFGSWVAAVVGRPERFAVCYTLGNVLNLSATCFLVGPERQWKSMRQKHRRVSSGVYLACMPLTLVCVYLLHSALLTLCCIVLQCCGLCWYALSYVPFGRSLASRVGQTALRWFRS